MLNCFDSGWGEGIGHGEVWGNLEKIDSVVEWDGKGSRSNASFQLQLQSKH